MLSMVQAPGAQVPTLGPITVGTGFASLYMPSARPLGPANDLGESTRQRRDTFSVGYKERVRWISTVVAFGNGDVSSLH